MKKRNIVAVTIASLLHALSCVFVVGLMGGVAVAGAGGATVSIVAGAVVILGAILLCPLALPVWLSDSGYAILIALPINSVLWGIALVWLIRKIRTRNGQSEKPNKIGGTYG